MGLAVTSLLLLTATQGDSGNGLTVDTLSLARVDGSYTDPVSKLGIIFNSTTGSLLIATRSGRVLVDVTERVGGVRVVSLGEDKFLQHSDGGLRDYSVPKHYHLLLEDPSTAPQLVPVLRELPDTHHTQVLSKSVTNLLSRPELKLVKEAAISLGHLGITGLAYPSALPLYMTAQRMDTHDFPAPTSSIDHLHLKRSNCLNACPPCKQRECLGMCGPGCKCWDWACGDCCYHKGCFYHDECCRTSPSSTACLLPVDFSCQNEYKCTKD